MNEQYKMMREFEKAAGNQVYSTPTALSVEKRTFRAKLIMEEVEEFFQAEGDIVKQVDGIIDTMVLLLGTLVWMGVEPEECFAAVHRANMRKFPNGKRLLRKDGKLMKPEGWYGPEPELEQILAIQMVRNDSDWEEAFVYAQNPYPSEVDKGIPLEPCLIGDIVQVIAAETGEIDRDRWVGVFKLKDGRYMTLSAWCDFTGWDDQAGGEACVGYDLHTTVKAGLDTSARKRLGYPE